MLYVEYSDIIKKIDEIKFNLKNLMAILINLLGKFFVNGHIS